MAQFPRAPFPRTALARNHMKVVDAAPEAMKANLMRIAADACGRRYDQLEMSDAADCLDYYLDSEDLYYYGQ